MSHYTDLADALADLRRALEIYHETYRRERELMAQLAAALDALRRDVDALERILS
jgi:predicted RNase H-like HicB family nuclease